MPINQLIELIEKISPSDTIGGNSRWSWRELSGNPNIPFEYILNHLDKPWNWAKISANPTVKLKDVLEYLHPTEPSIDWHWSWLSMNPSIKIDEMLNHQDLPWDWSFVSWRDDLTIDIVAEHLDLRWDWWNRLASNRNLEITLEKIIKYPNFPWKFFTSRASRLLECTMENILKYPRFPWNLWEFSGSSEINISLILDHLELSFEEEDGTISSKPFPWEWSQISRNPNIRMKDILEYPDLPSSEARISPKWHWGGISANPNISESDILNNLDKPWNWFVLSSNPNITANLILNTLDKPWNWELIAKNPMNRNSAAITIQRFYRKYGSFPRWRRRIEDSNMAILYNPKIGGIEFLREKELVEKEYFDE